MSVPDTPSRGRRDSAPGTASCHRCQLAHHRDRLATVQPVRLLFPSSSKPKPPKMLAPDFRSKSIGVCYLATKSVYNASASSCLLRAS
eukprot:3445823-Rhodomonas_salina.1